MSESLKTATPSVKSKEKSSLPDTKGRKRSDDIDIGNDFLSSWNPDDGMDFDLGPTTKGKKKEFKLDMDFSFGDDFKMDMPDFDISSPLKKSAKSKEGSKGASSGGEHRAKRDSFPFTLEFDEFNLDFESRTTKLDGKSNKSKDEEGHSNTSGSGGYGDLFAQDVDASEDDDLSTKHPAPRGVTIQEVDTQMDSIEDSNCRNEDEQMKSEIDENRLLKPTNAEEQEIHRKISPMQESHSSVKRSSPEPHAEQVVQDLCDPSLAENVSTEGAVSGVQEEYTTVVRMLSTNSGPEQNGNVKHVAELVSDVQEEEYAMVVSPNTGAEQNGNVKHVAELVTATTSSESQKVEMSKAVDGGEYTDHINGDDSSKAESQLESSMTPEIENTDHGEMIDKRNADSVSKLHMSSMDSGTTVDELLSENERENIPMRSKYIKRPNGGESELQRKSVSSTKLNSVCNKRKSTLPNNPAVEKMEFGSKSVESGGKFTGTSQTFPKVLSRDIPVQSEKTEAGHVKRLDDTRGCLNADNIKLRNASMVTTVANDIGPTKEEPVSRSNVHPTSLIEQSNKDLSQNCSYPGIQVTSMASTLNMSKTVVKKNRISPPKAEMRTPEFSSLRVSRATEQKFKPLDSLLMKGLTSMRSKEQGNMVLKRNPSVDTKKQTPSTPTLKRKTFEESAEVSRLAPLKRVSALPISNNVRASAGKVVDEQVCDDVNVSNEKSPRLDVSQTEMDISSTITNDGNVEKVEACSKELEDICNLLKKKHEEAKDVLVRAIVNNNNLLMLNHPIYQDKLRMVQKFATLLITE